MTAREFGGRQATTLISPLCRRALEMYLCIQRECGVTWSQWAADKGRKAGGSGDQGSCPGPGGGPALVAIEMASKDGADVVSVEGAGSLHSRNEGMHRVEAGVEPRSPEDVIQDVREALAGAGRAGR